MNNQITSCFMNEEPDFYTEVYDKNGTHIATLRALTPADEDLINRRADLRWEPTKDGGAKPVFVKGAYEDYHLLLSLGGTIGPKSYRLGSEGLWVNTAGKQAAQLNEENVSLLHPGLRAILLEQILKLKQLWLDKANALKKT